MSKEELGKEIYVGELKDNVEGVQSISRGGEVILEKKLMQGEENM